MMSGMYIHSFSAYVGEPTVDFQRLKEEVSRYTRVSFRRGNRFILLALLGACQCLRGGAIEADTAVYLTTEHGNLGETAAVLDEIYEARSLPKPYGFINTMSGTAAFYLAQTLGARGRSITLSSQHLSFERGLELLKTDFAAGGTSALMRPPFPGKTADRGIVVGEWPTGAAGFMSSPGGKGPAVHSGRTGRSAMPAPASSGSGNGRLGRWISLRSARRSVRMRPRR
jgi:hypothetical protein